MPSCYRDPNSTNSITAKTIGTAAARCNGACQAVDVKWRAHWEFGTRDRYLGAKASEDLGVRFFFFFGISGVVVEPLFKTARERFLKFLTIPFLRPTIPFGRSWRIREEVKRTGEFAGRCQEIGCRFLERSWWLGKRREVICYIFTRSERTDVSVSNVGCLKVSKYRVRLPSYQSVLEWRILF